MRHWSCKLACCDIEKFLDNLVADHSIMCIQSALDQFFRSFLFWARRIVKCINNDVCINEEPIFHSIHLSYIAGQAPRSLILTLAP